MNINELKWLAIIALIFIISLPASKVTFAEDSLAAPADGAALADIDEDFIPFLKVTGYYGGVTKEEVALYQKDQGLKATGTADLPILKKLGIDHGMKHSLKPGDYGKQVLSLQSKLSKKGYYTAILNAVTKKHNAEKTQKADENAANASAEEEKNKPEVLKTVKVKATAYTAHCKGCSGITKTGVNLLKHPDKKVIAVDPDIIPLGSTVYVPGYGYALAADTGGAINGHHIDIYKKKHADAMQWGVKHLTVQVIKKPEK